MENKEYLNEDNYQKGKKMISIIAFVILVMGILIGGSLITLGIINNGKIAKEYSEESKEKIHKKVNIEKNKLEQKKKELEKKGITYSPFAEYTDGDSYDLKIITQVLDPSFDRCPFEEYSKHHMTAKYCSLKEQSEDLDDGFNKSAKTFSSIPLFMIGIFIIISTCMMAGFIFLVAKRRDIIAFSTQQVMPIAQEGIEKMAPVYGNVAKEVTKGIKEGLKDNEEK